MNLLKVFNSFDKNPNRLTVFVNHRDCILETEVFCEMYSFVLDNRNAVVKNFDVYFNYNGFQLAIELYDTAPDNSQESSEGKWRVETMEYGLKVYTCPKCSLETVNNSNYCPNCGTYMGDRFTQKEGN